MDENQFKLLIESVYICKDEIINKLEDIRCGIIDVENETQKISESINEQMNKADA